MILNEYAPPAVLVNDQMEVLQFRGDTSHYLMSAPGKATFDLMRMLREGLMAELRGAIQEARRKQARVVRNKISVKYDDKIEETRIQVIPLKHPAASAPFYVVLFEEQGAAAAKRSGAPVRIRRGEKLTGTAQLRRVKEELDVTKQHLQSIIEEYEAANEEFVQANGAPSQA